MKSNAKRLTLTIVAAFAGMVEVANAFYDPGLQRWLNRDPIGQDGGINLCVFNLNAPTKYADSFGLAPNQAGACNSGHVGDFLGRDANLEHLRDSHADNQNRYFYTDQYGWVDIRHFAEAARRVREGEPGWWTRTLGFGNEVAQWLSEWGDDYRSGFSPEDLPSNNAGIDFAQSISPLDMSLADSFTRWANANGARSRDDSRAGFSTLPPTDPSQRGGAGRGSSNMTSSRPNQGNNSCPSR